MGLGGQNKTGLSPDSTILGNSLCLSEPNFLLCQMEMIICPLKGWREHMCIYTRVYVVENIRVVLSRVVLSTQRLIWVVTTKALSGPRAVSSAPLRVTHLLFHGPTHICGF